MTNEELHASDEEIAKIRAEIAAKNTPEKVEAARKSFETIQSRRQAYILTLEERAAAHRTVASVMMSHKPSAEELVKWVIDWACNGIDFYRDERETGAKHYIITNGPGISLADTQGEK